MPTGHILNTPTDVDRVASVLLSLESGVPVHLTPIAVRSAGDPDTATAHVLVRIADAPRLDLTPEEAGLVGFLLLSDPFRDDCADLSDRFMAAMRRADAALANVTRGQVIVVVDGFAA